MRARTIGPVVAAMATATWGTAAASAAVRGVLYVGSLDYNIYAVDAAGTTRTFANTSSNITGLAVDPTGNIYATQYTADSIVRLAPGGGTTTFALGRQAYALASDRFGNIYYTDSDFSGGVFKLTPAGVQSQVRGGIYYPNGVAVDASGNVYIATSTEIDKITPQGADTTFATFAWNDSPDQLAIDVAGNVYAAMPTSGKVTKITPGGVQSVLATGLTGNRGVAVDLDGTVYSDDTYNGDIYRITATGQVSVLANVGAGNVVPLAIGAVPEPASLALAAAGAAGLLGRRRRSA